MAGKRGRHDPTLNVPLADESVQAAGDEGGALWKETDAADGVDVAPSVTLLRGVPRVVLQITDEPAAARIEDADTALAGGSEETAVWGKLKTKRVENARSQLVQQLDVELTRDCLVEKGTPVRALDREVRGQLVKDWPKGHGRDDGLKRTECRDDGRGPSVVMEDGETEEDD